MNLIASAPACPFHQEVGPSDMSDGRAVHAG